MAVLEIRKYPDEVLKKKALPVENIDRSLQRLIDDMIETMYAAPGIGLAAPQVGISKRLIVIDVSLGEEKNSLIVLINPEIMDTEGIADSDEGCLSVPGYNSTIKRAEKVTVKGLDRNGKPVQIEGDEMLARALQHEIDHLDGILFVDRMSSIKKEFFKKKYLKKSAVCSQESAVRR
ncbi:MAG TPA: peptide deformylase [Nitrospiraceae bacterium]|nr:MAG: peptide deformylase [Nitrospirae bacterium GWA2_46_11]OGW22705.1 MAG: peptide deformylase [Nitrospirae bacterium GWB2_47_37]HAK87928.1 peptide deformylase [Nitrospiraceae bacterium]HCZ12043.1 peptide deformylase [Nitrospiraceae bacterium]